MVVNINSSPDTGDGVLSETEVARVDISYLSVTFSTDITNFKRRAFLLLAEGDQPGFQTTTCARPDPRDRNFYSNFQSFYFPGRMITLGFYTPEGSVLPNGRYRFIVCDTVTGTYPLLDGDSDGMAGGDLIRNFSVDRTTPTPTLTSTPTSTATSTATPTATSAAGRNTPTSTPRSLPQLSIDYAVGMPGSSFTVTGSAFPPNAHALVAANGIGIGGITTDGVGALKLFLDTSTQAAPGLYEVSVTVESGTSGLQLTSQSAKLDYTLRMDSVLRTHEPDETTIGLTVPADIQPQVGFRVYAPFVEVLSQQ